MIFAGLGFSGLFTFPSMIHFHGSLLPHGEVTAQTFAPGLGLLLSEAAVCLVIRTGRSQQLAWALLNPSEEENRVGSEIQKNIQLPKP